MPPRRRVRLSTARCPATLPLTARAGAYHLREAATSSRRAAAGLCPPPRKQSHRFLLPDPRFAPGVERIEAGRPAPFRRPVRARARRNADAARRRLRTDASGIPFAILRDGHLALEMPSGGRGPRDGRRSMAAAGPRANRSGHQLRLEYRAPDEQRATLSLEIDTRAPEGGTGPMRSARSASRATSSLSAAFPPRPA